MMEKHIVMVIDQAVVDEYNRQYFEQHPRAKKAPIKSPHHPSMNTWMYMKQIAMNELKQRWKAFTVWFVEQCGYTGLNIERCEVRFVLYFKTNIRHDNSNYAQKFLEDGLVEAGFVVDDDSEHIRSTTVECRYDKLNPRTEIHVYITEVS